VKVYVSDPWYAAAKVYLKDLKIETSPVPPGIFYQSDIDVYLIVLLFIFAKNNQN
jgi:hypothetical protein